MSKSTNIKKFLPFLIIIGLISIVALFLLPEPSSAQGGIIPDGASTACDRGTKLECGDYEVNDFIALAINISNFILGIVASLTLLMFIWGGQGLMMSGGSPEKIQQNKKTIMAAAIGLVIVFASFMLIKIVMFMIGLNWDGSIKTPERLGDIGNIKIAIISQSLSEVDLGKNS